METNQGEPTAQTQEPTVQEKNQETVKNPDAVLAKNRELLSQINKLKSERDEYKTYKEQTELERKERKGEFTEVIQKLKEENKSLKDSIAGMKNDSVFKTLKSQFTSEAKNLGCHDPEMFFEMAMVKHKTEFAPLAFDESAERYDQAEIKEVTEKLKDNFSYMFGAESINHTPINNMGVVKAPKKDFNDLSKEELIQLWKEQES